MAERGGNAARLHAGALERLREAGVTPELWARANFMADGNWSGASCGCPDPECIPSHHEAAEECRCLPGHLADFIAGWAGFAPGVMPPIATSSAPGTGDAA